MFIDVLFYIFASVLVISAIGVVGLKNPVHNLLCLVLCFFNLAGLFILLNAEFLAFLTIMVYIGAVVVMFMFVVMTINVDTISYKKSGYAPVIAASVLIGEIVTLITYKSRFLEGEQLSELAKVYQNNSLDLLGEKMFTVYAYPFIIVSLILLVAMIGAIVLTFNKQKNRKVQNISDQIARTREQSIEIKSVKSGSGINY